MNRFVLALAFVLACTVSFAQQSVNAGPYMLQLSPPNKTIVTGKSVFDLFLMDGKTMAPISNAMIKGTLDMPSMGGMDLAKPEISPGKEAGHYDVTVTLPMQGEYQLDLTVSANGNSNTASFKFNAGTAAKNQGDHMHGMPGMAGMQMKGSLGDWSMNREGSGTSWQPDSSPMYMAMLPKSGRYDLSVMGEVQTGYIDAGGKRGDKQGYANSMIMWMGQRDMSGGRLGLHVMLSADAITNGKRGVPNLFQTGETLNGKPLVDRQHPHDLLSELAVSFSKPINAKDRVFVYGGPVGEPALGNVMFMHRASGMEIPEAPITHHWFDSTHISFGVATLGLTLADKWKFEGSAFNGHEPDENRFDIDPIQLNSYSGRVSFNPDSDWSLSASYGFLKSPEQLEPGLNQHRLTASASYNRPLGRGDNLATTLAYGRLIVPGRKGSNGLLLESTWTHRDDSFFGRFERVDKDELVGVPAGSYTINKFLFGDVHNFQKRSGYEYGLGAYAGLYSFPSALKPFYGSKPVTWGVFLRVRPGKM